jgi:IS30 family transposase
MSTELGECHMKAKLVNFKVLKLKAFAIRVKTLTYDNGKEFVAHGLIDQQLNSPA